MNILRWVIRILMKMKGLFVFGTILIILEAQVWIAAVGLQQKLIDNVLLPQEFSALPKIVTFIGGTLLLYAILYIVAPLCLKNMVARVRLHLSKELSNLLQHISIRSYQKERTATFVHYFTQDVDATSGFIGEEIPRFMQQIAAALTLCTVVGFANPIILAGIILFSIVYIFLGRYFGARFKNQTKEVQKRKSDLLVQIEEGIASTREVIAFHRLKWEKHIYERTFGAYYESSLKQARLLNLVMLTSDPLKWMANLLILGYGGYLVMINELSLGMFLITYQFASQLMDTNLNLFNSAVNIAGRVAHVERIISVLGGRKNSEGELPLTDPIKEITLSNIEFYYIQGENHILKNITLELPIGKKIAIVGESGSGKSTIAQLLIKFFEPTSGQILINGIELTKIKQSDWLKYIRIVFQEPYLFPDTITNNLLLGQEALQDRVQQASMDALIHDFIMTLPHGYETVIGERGITLSGGQRQRLAIARAMLNQPEILILDEATSALDLETERWIQHNVDATRYGQTTIIIAHRLSTIRNADEIIVMDSGEVVDHGTHEELQQRCSIYKSLIKAEEEAGLQTG